MMPSRGMGAIRPQKIPRAVRRGDDEPVEKMAKGGTAKSKAKSKVNAAGNYTKPGMRKKLFEQIKNSDVQGTKAGQWSARKAQFLAKRYKEKGGGYLA